MSEQKLREALEFYADPSKYPAPLTGGMGALWHDCGSIARSARAAHEAKEPGIGIEGTAALAELALERRRQVEQEGRAPEADDEHVLGELALAAATYAALSSARNDGAMSIASLGLKLWPWRSSWLKPKGRRRDLVRAGALIVAELERLDRRAADLGCNAEATRAGKSDYAMCMACGTGPCIKSQAAP
jgi:hypothetical protein